MAASTAASTASAWRTYSPEDDLLDRFGQSLVRRARKRTALLTGINEWTVLGNPALDDAYDAYHVRFDGRRYRCSCRDHAGGEYRRVCSHVLAVIMWRQLHPGVGGQSERPGAYPPGAHEEPVSAACASSLPDPRDPMFGDPPLPEWVKELRPHQWAAVQDVLDQFRSGAAVAFLDAPTGTGKTLIGEITRRLLGVPRALYVCSTKTLQDQFLADFPYAKVLKGRGNYPTLDHPEAFTPTEDGPWSSGHLSAAECTKQKTSTPACAACPQSATSVTKLHCQFCHPVSACPYESAKAAALSSPLAVLNTSYLLTEANSAGRFSGYPLVIVDEADLLESELMSQVEVNLSPRFAAYLNIEPPAKKTVETAWSEWLHSEAIPKVKARLRSLPANPSKPADIRRRRQIERLSDRLAFLERGLADGGWVYTGDRGTISFRPVRVDSLGPSMLWRHAERWLLMSASLIDPSEMVSSLGFRGRPA